MSSLGDQRLTRGDLQRIYDSMLDEYTSIQNDINKAVHELIDAEARGADDVEDIRDKIASLTQALSERVEDKEIIDDLEQALEESNRDDYFILDEDFRNYAEEEAESMHAAGTFNHWPMTCIDWNEAAKDLESDYSQVTIGGYTYLYRY